MIAPSEKAQRRWFHWVPLTFPQKLLMLLLMAVVLPIALSVLSFSAIMGSYMTERSSYDGRSLGSVLATSLAGTIETGWSRADRVLLDYLATDDSVAFICLTDADGRPIHMSVHEAGAWDQFTQSQKASYAKGYFDVSRSVAMGTADNGLIIRTLPIYPAGFEPIGNEKSTVQPAGYVILGMQDIGFAAAVQRFQLSQVVLAALATIIIAPIILYSYRRWTKPLRVLRNNVVNLADGKMPNPLWISEDDDIGRLVQAVHRMSGSVLATQQQLREANVNLESLVQQRTIELREAVRELEQLSTTDVLTGLANRRAFYRRLEDDFARASVYRGELCVLMIDLDGFKPVNDTFGHDVGDEVLRIAAESIMACCDDNMTPARLGGDELVVLARHLNQRECVDVAERISATFQRALAERLDHLDPKINVTMSVGLASLHETSAAGSEILVAMADMALYSAKESGRSRVVAFDESLASRRARQHDRRRSGNRKEAA